MDAIIPSPQFFLHLCSNISRREINVREEALVSRPSMLFNSPPCVISKLIFCVIAGAVIWLVVFNNHLNRLKSHDN